MANGRIELDVNSAAQMILSGSVPGSGIDIVAGGKETLVLLSVSALAALVEAHTRGWEELASMRYQFGEVVHPIEDEEWYGASLRDQEVAARVPSHMSRVVDLTDFET